MSKVSKGAKSKSVRIGKASLSLAEPDLIPYVCHFDENTILTKDGELVKIIKISGFHESVTSEMTSLRQAVRESIIKHVKENNIALWFTTLRRKKDIEPEGEFKNAFAKKINQIWVEENGYNSSYVNELYISVIIQGLDTSIGNIGNMLQSIFPGAVKNKHREFLESANKELTKLTDKIIEDNKDYGARLLGLKEKDSVIYSEPMNLFGKIANLYEDEYKLQSKDMSELLASHKIAFGDYDVEVVGKKNKHFGTMLSLKEYSEVPDDLLDMILQLPFEFIITQSFDFIQHGNDLEYYQHQDYILDVSEDHILREVTNLDTILKETQETSTDFGELQTTFMIISDDKNELEEDVAQFLEQIQLLGLPVVRESIFSEHCFWSQLPANFAFLRRQKTINTNQIAGFASLYNFPAGSIDENHWGPAISILHTILNTPYFFSFHDGVEGNSLIMGKSHINTSLVANFLICQSLRVDPKIFYFDAEQVSKSFVNAIDGHYYMPASDKVGSEELEMNPLSLTNDPKHKKFLIEFFTSLVSSSKIPIPKEELAQIPEIVEKLFKDKVGNFEKAIKYFDTDKTKNLHNKLNIWNGPKLKKFFASKDEKVFSNQITGFDLSAIANSKPILIPIVKYLLYKIEDQLDGSPTIIVFSKAFRLLNSKIIVSDLDKLLDRLKEKNCIMIMNVHDIDGMAKSKLFTQIDHHFTSKVFFPDKKVSDDAFKLYRGVHNLSNEEVQMLGMMDENQNQFLLRHGKDSVIISLDLPGHEEYFRILANDQKSTLILNKVLKKYGKKSNWIAQLINITRQVIDKEIADEKMRIKQERIEKFKSYS